MNATEGESAVEKPHSSTPYYKMLDRIGARNSASAKDAYTLAQLLQKELKSNVLDNPMDESQALHVVLHEAKNGNRYPLITKYLDYAAIAARQGQIGQIHSFIACANGLIMDQPGIFSPSYQRQYSSTMLPDPNPYAPMVQAALHYEKTRQSSPQDMNGVQQSKLEYDQAKNDYLTALRWVFVTHQREPLPHTFSLDQITIETIQTSEEVGNIFVLLVDHITERRSEIPVFYPESALYHQRVQELNAASKALKESRYDEILLQLNKQAAWDIEQGNQTHARTWVHLGWILLKDTLFPDLGKQNLLSKYTRSQEKVKLHLFHEQKRVAASQKMLQALDLTLAELQFHQTMTLRVDPADTQEITLLAQRLDALQAKLFTH